MPRISFAVVYGRAISEEDGLADAETKALIEALDPLCRAGQPGLGRCWRDGGRPASTYWIGHKLADVSSLLPKTQLDRLPNPSFETRRDTHVTTGDVVALLPEALRPVLLGCPMGIWLIPDFIL